MTFPWKLIDEIISCNQDDIGVENLARGSVSIPLLGGLLPFQEQLRSIETDMRVFTPRRSICSQCGG